MRMREHKFKEFRIGDFEVQENLSGFGVYGPGDSLPRKVYKTFRAARLCVMRANEAARKNENA